MFIIERITGVGCYCLIALLFCFVIRHSKRTSLKPVLLIYTVFLALLAYLYKPYITADLYRIDSILNLFSKLSLNRFYHQWITSSATPAANLYYLLFAKFGGVHMMSAVSCFICFSLIFAVIADYAEQHDLPSKDVSIAVLYIMSVGVFMPAIGGIRMMLSLSICLWVWYRSCVSGNITLWRIILLIIAVGFHSMAFIVLPFMLVSSVVSSHKHYIISVVILLAASAAVVLLSARTYLFSFLIEKSHYYLYEDAYKDLAEYIIASLVLVTELIFMNKTGPRCCQVLSREDKLYRRLLACLMICGLCFCRRFSLFHRIVLETASLFSLPVLLNGLSAARNKGSRQYSSYYNIVFILSIILMLLNGARGSLSGYKFFTIN